MLDAKLAKQIADRCEELNAEGKLPSKSKLQEYYGTFRERFGPDKLRNLDGEALLDFVHSHGNHDSLVYWLEFKNDEEMPAIFGSIAGGSALKFGIYRRKDTGVWMAGIAQKQRAISVDEAIDYARRHRDQLIRGTQLLEELPDNGGDTHYKALQEKMDAEAPDVSNLAWGHKYFSLLYPRKLDDYHSPDYQRFHLIKLLQVPPEGEGRYVCAGRYVAIGEELGIPLNWLTTILNERNARPHPYWRIGVFNEHWKYFRDSGCVAVGFSSAMIGDMSEYQEGKGTKDALKEFIAEKLPEQSAQERGMFVSQLFKFVATIAEGDLIVACTGGRVHGVGRIVGKYGFEASDHVPDFCHRRSVEWLSLEEWSLPEPGGLIQSTVREIKIDPKYYGTLVEIERRVLHTPPIGPKPPVKHTHLEGTPGQIQSVLERKGQVILYGPPGTGKSYWAEIAARELSAQYNHGAMFDALTPDQKVSVTGTEGTVRMCCFHPAYGYEDFIEGYRPEQVDGQMVFNLRNGVFKKLCQEAQAAPQRRYYLIVDEINRGDIPRIFGELIALLEKDKRGKTTLLPLSGKPFQVPPNVYIIGTMNTADRSIALLDTALRRRFGFIEIMPDSSVLGNVVIDGIPLHPWLEELNRRICECIGRDARNLQIGHSYLFEGGKPISTFEKLSRVVREDIIPLLEEYCYEDYATLEKILGKSLVDAQKQRIRHELFDAQKQQDLIQALLAPCPDISTSQEAVTSDTTPEEEDEDEDAGENAKDEKS